MTVHSHCVEGFEGLLQRCRNVAIRHVVILLKNSLEFLNYKWGRQHMIDRQGCILRIYKMNNLAFKTIVEYRTKYSNKILFVLFYLSNISLEVGESNLLLG